VVREAIKAGLAAWVVVVSGTVTICLIRAWRIFH